MRFPRPVFTLFAVVSGLAALLVGDVRADRSVPFVTSALDGQQQIRMTSIGQPTWRPVDLHLFTAPIGSPPDFPLLLDTALALLNPPQTEHHKFHPDLFIGPGDPHGPPYDREFHDGIARLGFAELGPFTVSDFSDPNAVWLTWMTVPDPGTQGSSPDFASGPIIPNSLFPFEGSASTTRNGVPFSGPNPFRVPPLDDTLDPPFNVDGHSHFPVFYLDSTLFGPPDVDPAGSYTYHLTLLDNGGNGWEIEADFVVVACTITGTPGNNVLVGTPGNDVICGLAGNGTIVASGGNDTIIAGQGNDTVSGGVGHDIISGGPGNDVASGGVGNDSINIVDSVSGNDVASGGPGGDTCTADTGDVTSC